MLHVLSGKLGITKTRVLPFRTVSQTLILAECLATAAPQVFQVIDRRQFVILSVHLGLQHLDHDRERRTVCMQPVRHVNLTGGSAV